MKNLILCFVVLMTVLVACGSENVCDCPEDEKLDFFTEYYSVCSNACQLAVSVIDDCGYGNVTVWKCTNDFWNKGMSNEDCQNTLNCYQTIRNLNRCEWAETILDVVPMYVQSCPY